MGSVRKRGLVWLAVGIVIYFGGLALDRPLAVRFTNFPLGLALGGLGIVLFLWDLWQSRRVTGREGNSDKPGT